MAQVPSPYVQLPREANPLVLVSVEDKGAMRPQLCKVPPSTPVIAC